MNLGDIIKYLYLSAFMLIKSDLFTDFLKFFYDFFKKNIYKTIYVPQITTDKNGT